VFLIDTKGNKQQLIPGDSKPDGTAPV